MHFFYFVILLETLVDEDFNWQYLNLVYATRLDKISLKNLFREIARYDVDLDEAAKAGFPKSMSLTLILNRLILIQTRKRMRGQSLMYGGKMLNLIIKN